MHAYRNTALVLLTGFGVYFGVFVPALTANWVMIPVGAILLVAAVVLAIDTRRERLRASPSRVGSRSAGSGGALPEPFDRTKGEAAIREAGYTPLALSPRGRGTT